MYRILIVEDDMTIAKVLAAHLEKWGYETRCAENFKNIMNDFLDFEPQLLMLDIGCHFSMDFTGARRSGRCRRCRSCSSHRWMTT